MEGSREHCCDGKRRTEQRKGLCRNVDVPTKLTGSQLVKKFPAFYGTLKFITPYTSAHHLSLF